MKFTLPENAFPELILSKEHQEALIEEAEAVVRDTLAANETFRANGSKFTDPRWKLVRAKDGLNVYHHQRATLRSSRKFRRPRLKSSFSPVILSESIATDPGPISIDSTGTNDETSISSSASGEEMRRPAGFQMILHGTVDGKLDDAMFGTFAATNQAWMWRSSHINDRLDDARVLASIRGPTKEDPFRFLGVKWFVKERPAVLTGLVQQRDYLILEATGLTRDSKGEKVGYYLMHSIKLPRMVPELTELGLLRGDLSLCFIDRQRGRNKVEKYCRSFSDPRGKIIDRVAIAVTAESLICAASIVDYAYIKKLTWLMKHKGDQSASSENQARQNSRLRPKHCESCNKSFTKFSLSSATSGADCQICRRVICGKCSVVKKMTVDVSDRGSVKQCALRFCLDCLREARDQNVWEMALTGLDTASETSSASGSARTMKFTLPEDAFPALSLSKERQAELIQEADTVVRETIAANEEFIAEGATFRDPKWRLIRAKEGLNVYRQRRSAGSSQMSNDTRRPSSPHSQSSSWSYKNRSRAGSNFHWETNTTGERSESTENTIQDSMRRPGVSSMILHGTVDGNLDDCMFGTFASTDQAWMWRSSHLNDRLDDMRILATIRKPTAKDPFRFLGIKWFAKENSTVFSGIVQQRDFLIMEATGLTRDSKGDRVGYYLMHSVSLPGVPELSDMGIIRGELSLCFIDRQSGPGKVELFCRGFSDPRGGMLDRVSVAMTSEALMSAARVVDYAYIKKLTWLMKNKGTTNPRASDRGDFPRPTRCETCDKSFTKFSLTGVGAGAACQICNLVVCSKCCVVKKMTVDVSSTGSVKQCALQFCLSCLLEAKEKSVWELALNGVETTSECSSTCSSARFTPPI
ncbi:hypothetical protein PHMEG_00020344 [Phytophthora megakarya]|uniref:FYVE-type domain-containing protein n=1 Tax=Phytophthora megakarya TaxID=4795 RepID=A0A225VPC0_9STRA|nr:hypothetical protein PHMEG_00020344 [Phytophthora megakarya]